MIVNKEAYIKGDAANITFYGLILAIRGGHGYILEQRFLLPLYRRSALFARRLWVLPFPRQRYPRFVACLDAALGMPGAAQVAAAGNTWLGGRASPARRLPGAWQEEASGSRCRLSNAADASLATAATAQQQPSCAEGAAGSPRPWDEVVERSPLSASPRILLLPSLLHCLSWQRFLLPPFGGSALFARHLWMLPLPRQRFPSWLCAWIRPWGCPCATAPCPLPPHSHPNPVATVPIYAPSITPCCIEGETRGEKCWEPNRDKFLPASEKMGPRGRGSSFSAAELGGRGCLAPSMSFPTLFHHELDTRVRAIAHRLKQSVVQDNSINRQRKSIARGRSHAASRAGGKQKRCAGACRPRAAIPVWEKGMLERKPAPGASPCREEAEGCWGLGFSIATPTSGHLLA